MLYIAYGSNISSRRMKSRCPSAKFVVAANLKGYRLEFKTNPKQNPLGRATLIADDNASTPIVVWNIPSKRDWLTLDSREGHPYVYKRQQVELEINGKTELAQLYLMEGKPIKSLPSEYYYSVLLSGYEEFGFPIETLRKALYSSVRRKVS